MAKMHSFGAQRGFFGVVFLGLLRFWANVPPSKNGSLLWLGFFCGISHFWGLILGHLAMSIFGTVWGAIQKISAVVFREGSETAGELTRVDTKSPKNRFLGANTPPPPDLVNFLQNFWLSIQSPAERWNLSELE